MVHSWAAVTHDDKVCTCLAILARVYRWNYVVEYNIVPLRPSSVSESTRWALIQLLGACHPFITPLHLRIQLVCDLINFIHLPEVQETFLLYILGMNMGARILAACSMVLLCCGTGAVLARRLGDADGAAMPTVQVLTDVQLGVDASDLDTTADVYCSATPRDPCKVWYAP